LLIQFDISHGLDPPSRPFLHYPSLPPTQNPDEPSFVSSGHPAGSAWAAVRGCPALHALRDAGLAAEQVQAAVRIAAVVHAATVTLEAAAAELAQAQALAT
jgi:hypothetical protein